MALSSGFFKSAKLAAGAVAIMLTLAAPALARGGWGGGGWHGGGWHGGGWGGGWRGGGWRGGGWGGGWGPGWGGGWGPVWGVPVYGGFDPYYDGGYYGDQYPIVIRRARPVVWVHHARSHSCIWRRVHVHTCCGWRWTRVRYCAR